MEPILFQPSWPYNTMEFSTVGDGLYSLDMYTDMGSFDFLPSLVSTGEGSSEVSSSSLYFSTGYSDFGKDAQTSSAMEQYLLNLEESSAITSKLDEVMGHCELMETDQSGFDCREISIEEGEEGPSPSSMEVPSAQPSLVFPTEGIELDTQLSFFHLLKAYGEAMENGERELAEAIFRRLEDKACPTGTTAQRLGYYLIQSMDGHVDYLRQESSKNYQAAFMALYQIFPYGRFAHFMANSAILDSVPGDAETIHIVDFDMGEGLQWPPLIESLGRRHRGGVVRLTSIKWEEEDNYNCAPSMWRFVDTKRRLTEHANSFNLKLKVEEMEMEGLVSEMKKTKKRGVGCEWLAFNCMVGLPHMGRWRSNSHVTEFLKVAKDSISTTNRNRGIITLGDGLAEERMRESSGFGSFLEGRLVHFHGLLESMDHYFPLPLIEARIAMECLFVAPYFSSASCLQNWEERSWGGRGVLESGLEAWRMSKDSIAEAMELLKEGGNLHWVRSGEENENQIVLGYMGTPLVRVSSWR